ncbi:MAG: CoA-binding protein [Deltaproteobacteria bacterium]|nr:CoA-binding protein [Deltaproteobacteria bacterium]
MKKFFEPETVALIGASSKESHPGYQLFLNMRTCFGDRFYPVNPKLAELDGTPCYPSILDVPAEIDVAVVFIPAKAVPKALEQCAERGIDRVVIESSGFAEAGPEGQALNERCLEIARSAGMRLWGPNCMGLINVQQNKVLSFLLNFLWKDRFKKGRVSLVVQSGMLSAGFLASILSRTPFGLSKIASIGNKMDVDESDILEYLADDPETGVIALYLESIENGRRFYDACRSTDKPIVVLKSGRTETGARAAMSHTASLAQDDRIVDGALRQAGVIRVYDMNDLMTVARCLGVAPVEAKSGGRIAVMAFSGGAGVVAADSIADSGIDLARLEGSSTERLRQVYPEWMEPANPLDLYPAIERNGVEKVFPHCLDILLNDPGVDAIYLHIFGWYPPDAFGGLEKIAELSRKKKKPIVVWTMGDAESCGKLTQHLEGMGIPAVDEISKGVRVLSAMTLRR